MVLMSKNSTDDKEFFVPLIERVIEGDDCSDDFVPSLLTKDLFLKSDLLECLKARNKWFNDNVITRGYWTKKQIKELNDEADKRFFGDEK